MFFCYNSLGVIVILCHMVGMGMELGGRGKKKCKRLQRLFLAPLPGLLGISEGSETVSSMVETAAHPCPAGLHLWLLLLMTVLVMPGTHMCMGACVCVGLCVCVVGWEY